MLCISTASALVLVLRLHAHLDDPEYAILCPGLGAQTARSLQLSEYTVLCPGLGAQIDSIRHPLRYEYLTSRSPAFYECLYAHRIFIQ